MAINTNIYLSEKIGEVPGNGRETVLIVDAFLKKHYEVDRMVTEVRRLFNDWVETAV